MEHFLNKMFMFVLKKYLLVGTFSKFPPIMSVKLLSTSYELLNEEIINVKESYHISHQMKHPNYKPLSASDFEKPENIKNVVFHLFSRNRKMDDHTKHFKNLKNLKKVIIWVYWTEYEKRAMNILNFDNFVNLNIEYLEIINYTLLDQELISLSKVLKNQKITVLKLERNMIDEFKHLCDGIENSRSLTHLSILKNNVKDQEELFRSINCSKSLKYVNLSQNVINMKAFAKELINNSSLKELNLSDNNLTTSDAKLLGNLVKSMKLKKLNLSFNKISSGIIDLLNEIKNHQYLENLEVPFNKISKEGAVFNEFLLQNQKIKKLNLAGNTFDDESFEIVFKGVKKCNLEHLYLGFNNIKDMRHLNQDFYCLKHLKLNYLEFGDKGLKDLLLAIKDRAPIEVLDLSKNDIKSKDSGIHLKDYLTENKTLKELNLASNILTEIMGDICEGLKQNKRLKMLDLTKTELKNNNLQEINSMLKVNKSLKHLIASQNYFNDFSIEFLSFDDIHLKSLELLQIDMTSKGLKIIEKKMLSNYTLKDVTIVELNRTPEIESIIQRNRSFIKIKYRFSPLLNNIHFRYQ